MLYTGNTHHQVLRALILAALLALVLSPGGWAESDFRCATCQQKVQQGYTVDGRFYCPEHVDAALPRCSHCESPIKGRYKLVGPAEQAVCTDCDSGLPKCFLCSLPVSESRGGRYLTDGRHLCRDHGRNGVRSQQTARSVFRQAVQETVSTLGTRMRLKQPVKAVYLVDLNGLKSVKNVSHNSQALASGKVLGLTSLTIRSQGDKIFPLPATIHLLDWVPAERMLTVSVHEYTHAWHAENHKDYRKVSHEMREGFAEWVAYRVSAAHGREEQLRALTNPAGGIYYRGLQKFLALERRLGVEGTLKYAVTETHL